MKAINEIAAERDFTAEEQTRYDALKAEIKAIDARIEREKELVEAERNVPTVDVDGAPSNGTPAAGAEARPLPAIYGRQLSEDSPTHGFRTPREFLMSIISATQHGDMDERLRPLQAIARQMTRRVPETDGPVRAAVGSDEHSGVSDPYGNFAVPTGFSPNMLRLDPPDDPTRGVTRLPMTSKTVEFPARVDKNHSSTVTGGISVSRRPETVAATASRMEMEQIAVTAHSLIGLSYITEELLQDSPISFAAMIEAGFNDAFNDKLIRERIRGTGVGEMLGILSSPALVSVAKEGSQTADTIKGANLVKMRARAYRYGRMVWIVNHDCIPQLAEAHLPGTNSDVNLWQPGRGIDVPDMLLGRPVIVSEYASTLGDQGDVLLVDWAEYLEGLLQNVQGAESMHVRFSNNERAFRFTMRIGGAPWWRSALTPVQSSTTLSPYVTLDARA